MSETKAITIDEMCSSSDIDTIDRALDRSYVVRGADTIFAMIDDLEIGPGDLVLDVGGREAWHSLALVQMFGCRAVSVEPVATNNERARMAVAAHPQGSRVSIRPGVMEEIPATDVEFAFILSHDMFFQVVDADRALAESHRVLTAGGHLLVYQTFATDRLEPQERSRLYADLAVVPERMDPKDFEARALAAGFVIEVADVVGSEWREVYEEDGVNLTSRQLLYAARLLRRSDMLRAELGETPTIAWSSRTRCGACTR